MADLIFNDGAAVAACIREAIEAKEWKPSYGVEAKGPALWLVHDEGVYLMSNSATRAHGFGASTAFAEGCHPQDDPDWFERAHELVGGDDFCQHIEIDAEMRQWLQAGIVSLRVSLTDEHITLDCTRAGPLPS